MNSSNLIDPRTEKGTCSIFMSRTGVTGKEERREDGACEFGVCTTVGLCSSEVSRY